MIQLDDRDLKILTILQADGRITKAALAEKVNLSPAACWDRLKRLEGSGLITGYEARINPALITAAAEILMSVELESHTSQDFRAFEDGIATIPEIVECWAVGGGIDYMLRVLTSDIAAYQRLVDGMLEGPLGVKRYYTYVVTKLIKRSPIPLLKMRDALTKDHR